MPALLDFALDLALIAESEILPRFRNCEATRKSDGTLVTEADRAAETAIREAIQQRFPDDAVWGEEHGRFDGTADRTWLIDPLDGTAWFALGLPLFGTLIAVLEEDRPIVGVIHCPALNETTYAARGAGAWHKRGGQPAAPAAVAGPTELADALVSTSGWHGADLGAPDAGGYRLSSVAANASRLAVLGDCIQHSLVCRGSIHAAIDTVMSPWDTAALIPCIEEAGGIVTSLSGATRDLVNAGSLLSSSHPDLHRELLRLLAPSDAGAAKKAG